MAAARGGFAAHPQQTLTILAAASLPASEKRKRDLPAANHKAAQGSFTPGRSRAVGVFFPEPDPEGGGRGGLCAPDGRGWAGSAVSSAPWAAAWRGEASSPACTGAAAESALAARPAAGDQGLDRGCREGN